LTADAHIYNIDSQKTDARN